jgi:hypothetical protein
LPKNERIALMKTRVLSLLLISVFLSLNVFAQTSAENNIVLRDHWFIRSSSDQAEGLLMPMVRITDDGRVISQPGYASKGWYPTSVPSTVLATLVANKVYPDPYYGNNLMELPGMRRWDSPESNPFESSWWYRTEFDLPSDFAGKHVWLKFHSVNYRAILWVNGHKVADSTQMEGAYRLYSSKVEMLGSDVMLKFVQDDQGLSVTFSDSVQALPGIADQQLASGCRVLRVTHDKGWINDDDPGTVAPGWLRRCNLGTGDFNNDLTTSDIPGDAWNCSFTGSNVSVIAPKEAGAGRIEVMIDGQTRAKVDLSTGDTYKAQQAVCEVTDLTPGRHVIKVVNLGGGPVAVDAIVVK